MNKISSTGDGLHILIVCDNVPHHDWLTFAAWYSIAKMIPDAKVGILCNRKPSNLTYFSWTKTCRVNMRYHQPLSKEEQVAFAFKSYFSYSPLLVIEPDVLIVREIDSILNFIQTTPHARSEKVWVVNDYNAKAESCDLCCDVKEDKSAIFVSYAEGWGKFVMASWINKVGFPFQKSFGKVGINPNEAKVKNIWERLGFLFPTVTRG